MPGASRFAWFRPGLPRAFNARSPSYAVAPAGRMLYQVCEECRLGLVGKITTDSAYQGLGIGTRLVLGAFARYPSYAWHTTSQYPASGTFWASRARRTGAAVVLGLPTSLRHLLGLRPPLADRLGNTGRSALRRLHPAATLARLPHLQ
jgi:hypothetical protein